ncbi:DUF4347 domain-containing protein, partial [Uliginosibacterium flavum]
MPVRQFLRRTFGLRSVAGMPIPRKAVFEEVEARLLYSADLAPGISDAGLSAEIRVIDSRTDSAPSTVTTQSTQHAQQLVFIDSTVADADKLLADVRSGNPDAEVISISSERDGISQISEALAGRSNVSAIHLITHGSAGELKIGNSTLNASTVAGYSTQLESWRKALSTEADLLIYGCNFAANDNGQSFADELAKLTGADVAASSNLTGDATQGGDWTLEYQRGEIEATVTVSTALQQSWAGTLAIVQDSVSTATTTSVGASSLSFAHTVGTGTNGILIVEYATRGTTSPDSITYNGVALTRLDTNSNSTVVTTEIWYLKTPAAGTHNIVITMPGAAKEFTVGASSYFNVDQTATFGTVAKATGTGTAVSVNVVSASGDLVIDAIATRQQTSNPSTGAGQTQRWTNTCGVSSADPLGAGSSEAGAASVTMSWTLSGSQEWATLGVSLNAAPSVAPVVSSAGALTITQDAVTTAATSTLGATSLTLAHTVGAGTNSILIVEYSTRGTDSPTSITYNGVALTRLDTNANSTVVTTEIWYLKNPAAGAHNIVVTMPGSAKEFAIGATSYFNVDQTSTFGTVAKATGTGTAVSVTVASATGNLVIDAMATRQQGGVPSVGSGQIQRWTNSSGTGSAEPLGAGSSETGAASVTMSWTLADAMEWATIGVSLNAANDASGGILAYTENAAATPISTTITVTDADSSNLTGATIQITSNYQNGQDVLAFTNQLGITGSWNASTGMMTLTGTASVANYQTALRAVTYANTSNNPNTSTRTVTFIANDGTATGSATRSITVAAVNDAPVVTAGNTLVYTENGVATAVSNALTLTDADSTNLTGATIQITSSYQNGQDVLAFTTQNGITGSWNATTGMMTLTGTTTAANYQSALRSLTYANTSDNPSTLARTVTFIANDGATTGSATASITVAAVNDAPVVTAGNTLAYTENGVATAVSSALTLTDADSTNLTGTTIQITGNYQNGQDVLAFTTQNGITGSWNATTGMMTLTGTTTVANYQSALRSLTYANTSDNPSTSTRTLTFIANDGAATGSATSSITVAAANDAPTATITPASYNATEQTSLTLHGTGLAVSDADAGSSNVTVTVTVVSGTLTAAAGSTGAGVSGSGTAMLTLTGTLTQINNLLAGSNSGTLTYTSSSNTPPASDTLTLQINDGGNTGSGGTQTGSDTATINLSAVNDAPTATITPTSYNVNEQTTLTLQGTGLAIADVDAASASVTATVSVVSGTLSAAAGTTGVGISGSGTSSITLTGTLTQINNLLAGNLSGTLSYIINSNTPPASDTLTLGVNDGGNTGSGGAKTGSDTASINITAINDAPTNTVPGAQATDEDTALVFSSGNGNRIQIADVDAASGSMQITLSVTNGTLTLAGTTGLSFSSGDGTGDASMIFTGTVANINTALATLTYNPTANYNGAATLTLITNDQGNTGSGGAQSDTDNVSITVNAINDSPVNSVPGAQSVAEDTNLAISGITINDVDLNLISVALSVNNGTLNVTLSGAASISAGVNGTATLTVSGTQADMNATLASLIYRGTLNYNGSDTLTVLSTDSNGATDSDTVGITVTAGNDAPTNTVPGTQATDEDTALVFSSGNGNQIQIADVDAASGSMQITLSVTNGTLTLAGTTGLSFSSGDGTGDASMIFSGTVANINTALATLTYNPTANFNGAATLTLITNDQGNTGSGGARSDTDNVSITVNAINDSPINSVPGAQVVAEDTNLAISGITVNDVDLNLISVALSVNNGTLNVTLSGAASISAGVNGTAALTVSGTQADINATLASLIYRGTLNYSGSDTLTVLSTDSNGATDSDTVGITVTAVNDAPVNSVPGAQATDEDTALVFSAGNGNQIQIADVDAASGSMQITLSVTNGTLTLAGVTGLSFSSGDGTGDASMIFTGTVANINTALATLTYNPTANFNGAATLTLITNDQGNTGSGGARSDTDNVSITVNAINDAPGLSTTGTTLSYTENAAATAVDSGITVSDIDSANLASAVVQITGNYQNGQDVLAFANQNGITGSWNAGTGTLTLTGSASVANYQTALRSITYQNTSNNPVTTTRTVSFTVNDGALDSNTATRNIGLTAVNDDPVNSVPGAQAVDEDDVLVFSAGNGNQIQIADVDAASGSMQVTLSVTHGTLTLAGTTGLSFSSGDGTGDASMIFTGTVANINTALATLTYNPTANYNGAATLTLITNDQGNTGTGGAHSDTDNVSITVNPINDAPVANDDSASTAPGVPIDVNVKANDSDVDNVAGDLTVTIISNSPGTSATVNPDGTINFDPGATNGAQTVTYQLTDVDGLQSGIATLTINVAANNLPTSLDDSATFDEDTSYSFLVSDFDFSDADGTHTLAGVRIDTLPLDGTLTLSGVAVTAGQTITTANITNLLFTPALNANGSPYATFTFSVQDSIGGYDASPNTFTLNVDAVNDAPVNTLPASQNTTEDNSLTLSIGNGNPISISDIDAGGASMAVTLSVTNGTLTLAGITGLSFTTGDGTADGSMVFTGSIVDINTALNGLIFAPTADFNGTATLTLTTDDQSNTGSGGAKTDTDNLTINVDPANDAPALTTTGSTLAYTENAAATAIDGGLTASDIDSANLNGATIQISSNYQNGEDVLAFANQNGISGSWDAGTGTLTLSGSASAANYQTALRSITYQNTSNAPSTATRSVSFTVSDGSLSSNTATRDISVANANDAPVVTIAQPSYSASEQVNLSLAGTGLSLADV